MKNYYDMLSVAPEASADEIKKAFRREIARYHPDKVQHLGSEFQEMAAGIAADLTEAYRILMDPEQRAKYDAEMRGGSGTGAPPAPRPPAAESGPPPAPPWGRAGESRADPVPPPAQRPTAGFDFVKRASLAKLREAIGDVLAGAEALPASGFDIAIATRPKKGFFKKAEERVCLVLKFVPFVDAAAVADVWPAAARLKAHEASGCVVLLAGPGLAPAPDLAAAVNEQRRKSRGAGPLLVPVDVRDWEALFPPETPGPVRSLIQRLKDEKR